MPTGLGQQTAAAEAANAADTATAAKAPAPMPTGLETAEELIQSEMLDMMREEEEMANAAAGVQPSSSNDKKAEKDKKIKDKTKDKKEKPEKTEKPIKKRKKIARTARTARTMVAGTRLLRDSKMVAGRWWQDDGGSSR